MRFTSNTVVIFGLYETGLGIAWALRNKGLTIFGIDFKKDIGWYSRFVKPLKSPHPVSEEGLFIEWIEKTFSEVLNKIPVYLSSDVYLYTFSKHRDLFGKYFIYNLPDHSLLEKIINKYQQHELALKAGISVPQTFEISSLEDIIYIKDKFNYPLFIKGKDVNSWRNVIGGKTKGFVVKSFNELITKAEWLLNQSLDLIVQEVIIGPDTNHYKYCAYISSSGKVLCEFTLQKVRQSPVHFGVGAVVESIYDSELTESGRRLLLSIGFIGVGSVEFKRDERDGKLKLIEINPRYWQQNYLTTYCGVNFPYINYQDLMGMHPEPVLKHKTGIKWINRQLDFNSFLDYKKEGVLSFRGWRKTLNGRKIYSDFLIEDPLPALVNVKFGWLFIKFPFFIGKRIFKF